VDGDVAARAGKEVRGDGELGRDTHVVVGKGVDVAGEDVLELGRVAKHVLEVVGGQLHEHGARLGAQALAALDEALPDPRVTPNLQS
jgi:hypothetical protein